MGGVGRDTHENRCTEPYEEEADGERWEWRSGGLEGVADGDDERCCGRDDGRSAGMEQYGAGHVVPMKTTWTTMVTRG